MAQQYPPYDLVNQALQSLSLEGKLPKLEENEVDDASILKALTDKAALSAMLNECIPVGRVPMTPPCSTCTAAAAAAAAAA